MRVRVIGAGVMGRGIAQWAITAGHEVELADISAEAVSAARSAITDILQRLVDKGRMDADDMASALSRLHAVDAPTAPGDLDLVIEAVKEDIEIKAALFRELEAVLPASAILATNTSSIPVTRIGATLQDPTRVAGLHFFNPAPLMKVVEVIPGMRTSADVVERLVQFVESGGHRPVVVADTPGFLINHAGRGLVTEAFALLEDCVATESDIDVISREVLGLRMGPFELMDLTGLDVTGAVIESIWTGFRYSDRLRASYLTPNRVAAGLFGRKTGRGFYDYADGAERPATSYAAGEAQRSIWIDPTDDHAELVTTWATARGARIESGPSASDDAIVLVAPWGSSVTSRIAERGLPASRTLGVDPLCLSTERVVLAITPATDRTTALDAVAALGSANVTVVNDTHGSVAQRLLASIVGVAASIAERGIATPADIDTGVRLGLGYPVGPLAWGDRIGAERMLGLQQRMFDETGDARYRPSPWIAQRARLGLALTDAGTRTTDLLANRPTKEPS